MKICAHCSFLPDFVVAFFIIRRRKNKYKKINNKIINVYIINKQTTEKAIQKEVDRKQEHNTSIHFKYI